ncbi:DUF3993 domain-containing protein [Bacillus sp. CGMCC 1.16607]|uniref:DUF3993 domain-containing protein n=1 Tax=Bacillus sp. CGMCC 1.16607 TaxID=3351842 RepID=UPI0036328EBE
MWKKYVISLLVAILVMMIIPISPMATDIQLTNREDILKFMENAYFAQSSLSEMDRSMDEIDFILDPYFSNDYKRSFLDSNIFEENGKFTTYGTDFGQYYIPYHRFSSNTNIVIEQSQIYLFEYFPKNNEGPVGYEDHYEGILIEKIEGEWKISKYLYNDIPQKIIDKAENQVIAQFERRINDRFTLLL